MARKSIYFPDKLLPRVQDAAAREGRSVSQWVSRACEAAMSDLEPLQVLARQGAHLATCRCPVCKPPKGS